MKRKERRGGGSARRSNARTEEGEESSLSTDSEIKASLSRNLILLTTWPLGDDLALISDELRLIFLGNIFRQKRARAQASKQAMTGSSFANDAALGSVVGTVDYFEGQQKRDEVG